YRHAAAFEDGTLNFLDIAAVPDGLDYLERIGIDRIHEHVQALTRLLLDRLLGLRHANGAPLVRLYGPQTTDGRGGTVAFNLLSAEGKVIDCRLVERAAIEAGISIRTGYFCNPGAAEASFELPDREALRCYEELAGDDFTLQQFSACLDDRPVGAIRVSLGLSSSVDDVERLIGLLVELRDRFANGPAVGAGRVAQSGADTGTGRPPLDGRGRGGRGSVRRLRARPRLIAWRRASARAAHPRDEPFPPLDEDLVDRRDHEEREERRGHDAADHGPPERRPEVGALAEAERDRRHPGDQ